MSRDGRLLAQGGSARADAPAVSVGQAVQAGDGSSQPVDTTGTARAMLERAFPQAGQTSVQGVAQNTAAPVVNGQPVYSDLALADYMAKQAARQKFGDVQQTPVGLQETMHAQDMSASPAAIPEENVVASAQNDGTIGTDQKNLKIKLEYITTSGLQLKAVPDKTTTILGTYADDMESIIGELAIEKSLDFGPRDGGFNVLNTPDELYNQLGPEEFWNQYNRPWLDNVIARGDIIKIATEPSYPKLYRINNITGQEELTGFGREFMYLKEKGFIYDSETKSMVKKRRGGIYNA